MFSSRATSAVFDAAQRGRAVRRMRLSVRASTARRTDVRTMTTIAIAAELAARPAAGAQKLKGRRNSPIMRKPMAGILVVDDEAHIRDVVRYALERDGFSVITAANGIEALAAVRRSPVDLI